MEYTNSNVDSEIAALTDNDCHNIPREKPLSPILNSAGLGVSRRNLIKKRTKLKKTRVNLCERFRMEILSNQTSERGNIALLKNSLALDQLSEINSIDELAEVDRVRKQFYNLITANTDEDFCFKMPSPVPKPKKIMQQLESSTNITNSLDLEDVDQDNTCLHLNSVTIQSNKIGFQTAGGHKVEIPDGQLQMQMHLFDDILLRGKATGKRDNKYNFLRKPNNMNHCITKTADLKLDKSFNISHHMPDISDTQLVTETEKIMGHNNLDNITQIPKSKQFYGFHYDEITKSYEMHRIFVKSYQDFLKRQTQEKSQSIDNKNYRKRQLDDIPATENKRMRIEFDMDKKEKYSNNRILNNISRGFSTASGKILAISKKSLDKANKIFEEISSDLDPIKNRNETDSLLKAASPKDKKSTGITCSTSSRKDIDVSENSLINSNKISKEINSHQVQCDKIRYSSTGFSTASKKPINVSKDSLKKADNIFNEINNESSPNTLITINNECSNATKKILDGSENSLQAKNKISKHFDIPSLGQPAKVETHSNIITKASEEIKTHRFDKNGFISTGFSTASKKLINVSESSLKKADNILKEVNAESSSDNLIATKNNTFSNAPEKIVNVSENSLQAGSEVSKHSRISSSDQPAKIENRARLETKFSSDNVLNRCNIPKGFSTGSGKIINVSENSLRKARTIFDDINTELSAFKSEPSTYKNQSSNSDIPSNQSSHNISRGFSTVSGKPINISTSALAKANNIFETISSNIKNEQLLIRDQNTNANFSNISKNSYIPSERSACSNDTYAAPVISNILEVTDTTMNNIGENEVVNQNATNISESVPETIAQRVSRNKLKLLDAAIRRIETLNGDDYSDREDLLRKEAIKKMGRIKAVSSPINPGLGKSSLRDSFNSGSSVKLLPTISSKSSKRKLGISTCQQIQISEEKLQRAKMLFAEEFPDLSPIKPSVRANFPSHSFGVNSSTPIARRSVLMSMEKTAVDCNTPRKAFMKSATNECPTVVHKNNLSIVITEPTSGTVLDWSENMTEECKKLERKLNVLRLRNEHLCLKKEKSETEKRPKEGVLHMKKNLKDKIILRSLTLKENPEVGEISLITSQNAEKIHFREFSPFLVTEDGAIIIPNSEDLIGLSEIEHGFKLMPGIDPALIPNGWIRNHFKWIIWKIASYERNLADQLEGTLTVENVIQQLKYRYDREIDKAERSALRRIYEKDDASQKRMILCVSNIILSKLELELTDGWYSIRTVVDEPLQNQISSGKITVGTKVITSGAELVNCDGCNPLEATYMSYLKINYNCTRRALWYTKLGFQTFPGPFPIRIESVHPAGGPIGLLKLLVVRSYPIKYLERLPNKTTVWRNIKAEERAAQRWENEQCKQMEKLQDDASDKMDKISDKSGKDLESCRQELMSCLQESIKKLRNRKRNVSSVLRLLVFDTLCESSRVHNLSIWSPSEFHLQNLMEGAAFSVSNVLPRANGDLCTGSKTMFTAVSLTKKVPSCFERKSTLIDELDECNFSQDFQEFDCVGLVLKIIIESKNQLLWLCGTNRRLLMVRIFEGPDTCSLLDNLRRGTIVTACNLVYKKRKDYVNEAIANHNSVFSYYPQHKHLQTGLEEFKTCCPKDLDPLYKDCDDKIANYEQRSLKSAKYDSVTGYDSDEDTLSMSCLTSTDVALSLIDMDKFM